MSAAESLVREDSHTRPRVPLRVIPGFAQRRRTGFGLLIVGILGFGLIAALLFNTVLAQGAFTLNSVEREVAELTVAEQELSLEVAAMDTPSALQNRARQLGMVPMSGPVFLRLRDGRVLGTPSVAVAAPKPTVAKPAKPKPAGAKSTTSQPVTPKPAGSGDAAVAAASGDGAVGVSNE